MVKKYKKLIDKIISLDNLRNAYINTSRGKKLTYGYLEFKEYAEANLILLQQELADGAYRIGDYRNFTVFEPKPRLISSLEFKDRLVQHALCNVIAPIFEKTLLPYTFACRIGKGTHAGVKYIQSKLRSTNSKYFLKTDYSKFFPNINRSILHERIERKISCKHTLDIIREIVPVSGNGLPIGSLTSQLFANVYGGIADRYIHFNLGCTEWARYMDDIIILGNNKEELLDNYHKLNVFSKENMNLNIGKWQVSPTSKGINFLGYRIWNTHKLLRKDSVLRAKRKINRYIKNNNIELLDKFIASWSGHSQWADTNNLFNWLEKKYAISLH